MNQSLVESLTSIAFSSLRSTLDLDNLILFWKS